MPSLATDHRSCLEKAIVEARAVAEAGAKKALEALAVHHHEPYDSMPPALRTLRNRLRAHGRQVGDRLDSKNGMQTIHRLVREVAYEHWHRMLFARFLAENGLLIEPATGVAITMAECEDLARERGEDPWAMASSFAQGMLPRIFRGDDPSLAVVLPPESRQAMQKLLADLPTAIFTADDALGWTYQFWQAAEKDAVNARVKSGEKITGETLPAVTQLFTEHYMVQFLLHNTIGAWHAGKVLAGRPDVATTATCEQELRDAVRLSPRSGYDFEYLRFVRDPPSKATEGDENDNPTGRWRPAAGVFEGWPRTAAELTVLDPCCGSGHFIVAAFELLVHLRMAEEGLSVESAIHAVIADNLFGLELDPRCTQIAAFNLALAAWRMAGSPIELPPMRIACSGLGPQERKEEWLKLADQHSAAWEAIPEENRERIRNGLMALHETFSKAPELGSLIDPTDQGSSVFSADYATLRPFLEAVYRAESSDDAGRERAVAAKGMADAAQILVGLGGTGGIGYTLVMTNVPYLGRKAHTDELKQWADARYEDAKNDLATMFVARMLRWVGSGEGTRGSVAAVTPQNWLFLTSYRKLRERLLKNHSWNAVARLGNNAFQDMNWWAATTMLLVISGGKASPDHLFMGSDVSADKRQAIKAALLRGCDLMPMCSTLETIQELRLASASPAEAAASRTLEVEDLGEQTPAKAPAADGSVRLVPQAAQLKNPDARVVFVISTGELLEVYASDHQGLSSGDNPRFRRPHWEVMGLAPRWSPEQSTVDATAQFGGREGIILWDDGNGELRQFGRDMVEQLHDVDRRGQEAWGRDGIGVCQMGTLPVTRYMGQQFDTNVAVLLPHDPSHLPAIWCFCSSPEFASAVRRIDQKVNVTNATLAKVPFDLAYWQRVAAERYPNGLPDPQSDDPTQWLFHGHPAHATAAATLQVAVARLLGYRWPAELDSSMRLAQPARARVNKCKSLDALASNDGIVCLASVRGGGSAADRLRALLAAAFKDEPGGWTAARERDLRAAAGEILNRGKASASLDEWLRERFFEEHCALFHRRPFIWHIWDGRADGFNALVNYHKLAGPDGQGLRTLNALAYTYLGEWIERQRAEQKAGTEGADGRLAAAMKLQSALKKIIDGEPPCDLFVRWKPLHDQPLGWEPDINDGVRLNIRPFLMAGDVKVKDAGVLRVKPDNTWSDKKKLGVSDRGKEPEKLRPRAQFPWFWGCDPQAKPEHRVNFGAGTPGSSPAGTFDGVRWNGLHYSRAAKEAARRRRQESQT